MHSFRDHALALAQDGFRVFPLAPGRKTPVLETDWRRIATTDPDKVRAMWTDDVMGWDQPFNIGIALDANTVVVDVDVRDGRRGAETLRLLEAIHDPLPSTYWVRTASKGDHHYFRVDGKRGPFAKTLGINVDLKTLGGYVVGSGSVIDGKRYAVVSGTPRALQALPEAFVEISKAVGAERAPAGAAPLVELDEPSALARAVEWLATAPESIEGDRGDDTAFAVAAKMLDFGLSPDTARDALLDHWNDRCSPPWSFDEIETKLANAAKYRKSPIGIASPEAEFEAVEVVDKRNKPALSGPLSPQVITLSDVNVLPPRQWLYGKKLSRKYTAFVASPGGVGKTAWVTSLALACASGRQTLHDKPHHPMRVWMFNLEDDMLELRRRVAAAMRFHEIPESALENLRVNSGRDRGLKVVKLQNDALIVQPDANTLVECMLRENIELLIVDPFLRSHSVPENTNEAQDEVMRVYASIADRTNAAILLVHHTKKGASNGDQEDMRGAAAQGGGARSVMMLSPMRQEEAARLGIPERKRRLHVRVDDGKNNMAPPAASAEWIHLAGMSLDNGTPDYPDGDSVQVAHAWAPPEATAGLNPDEVEACVNAIAEGMPDGERYTARSQDKTRWAGRLLEERFGRTHHQATEMIRDWLATGRLETRDFKSPTQRRDRKGLFKPDNRETSDA